MGTGRKLYWIVSGAIVMVLLELVLFYCLGLGKATFAEAVRGSFLVFAFVAFSTGFTMYAVSTYKKNKKTTYRYQLMDIRRGTAFLVTSLAGALVYMFYWAVQAILLYVLLNIYLAQHGDMTGIEIYTQMHEDALLLCVMPLGSLGGWLGVIIRALLMGIAGATAEYFVRNGAFAGAVVIVVLQLTNTDYAGIYAIYIDIMMAVFLLILAAVLTVILNRKVDETFEGGVVDEA